MKLQQLFSCPMKWEKLQNLDDKNKFCELCEKKIYDFTNSSEKEIEEVFKQNDSVCSRVKTSQLSEVITPFQKFLVAVVFCFSGTLFSVDFAYGQKVAIESPVKKEFKRITGYVIDDYLKKPVSNATVMFKLHDHLEYEVKTNSSGYFEIDIPRKYVALNLNIIYEDTIKLKYFIENMYSDSTDIGSLEINTINEEDKKQIVWIKGRVLDDVTSETLIGAPVYCKKDSNGVVTDLDGKFSLPISMKEDSVVITVSFIGYTTQNIIIKPKEYKGEELEIIMNDDGLYFTVGLIIQKTDMQNATFKSITDTDSRKVVYSKFED